MPLSNSVIRCYTPPTCTLEVFAQSSPLSRWMGKTVLKHLSFELRFDDPRIPEEKRVPIRGDREQLEALCDAVTSYVQQFLQQPPESFWASFASAHKSSTALDEPEFKSSTKTLNSFSTQISGANIYLEPSSYLTHNLFLGSLANHASGPVIQLTLLQLFDLASALDEYSTDVMALPTLNSTSTLRFPTWAPVAAVLVLGVGLLPVTWQYANNMREKQQQTAKTADPAAVKTALEPSPSLNFPTPQPGLSTPSDNLLGSTAPLPTSSLPQAPLTVPSSSFSTPPPLFPKNALTIPQGTTATLGTNPAMPSLREASPTASFSSRRSANANAPSSKIPGQEIAILPNLGQNPTASSSQPDALPHRRNLPSRLSSTTGSLPTNISPVPPSLDTIPNNSGGNTVTQPSPLNSQQLEETINSLQSPSPGKKPTSKLPASRTGDNNPFIDQLGNGRKTPTSTQVATNGTLFDTPQVAEAREYLIKRWQPPTGLAQTLEYSLMVSVDGTVERIFPLNKAAREYVDSAGMPELGKPFVSANTRGQNVRIRVVLSPDGKVQTFSEQ